jgi:NAD(P)-dependent dehydrogenase (short-subunit alcohol dehydrogenase family)
MDPVSDSCGSRAVKWGLFGQANYASAKARVQAMLRVLSREAGRKNVRANANAPGMRTKNRKTKDHDPEFLAMPMDGEFRHRR